MIKSYKNEIYMKLQFFFHIYIIYICESVKMDEQKFVHKLKLYTKAKIFFQ